MRHERKDDDCEDEYEALNLMVSSGRKTAKELASYLFPDLKIDSAYARLKACMNPEKSERMNMGQIEAAMIFCDNYAPLNYWCDRTHHHRPEHKAPQDEEVKLVQVISDATEIMQRAMTQLEHLKKAER